MIQIYNTYLNNQSCFVNFLGLPSTAHKSLRGQAKKEGLATIEAVAFALECLGDNAEVGESLRKQYVELIVLPNLKVI
jgi:DTW domain-containing protein YfiP